MNEMIMVCHSLNNNTCTGLVISLCLNPNSLISLIPTTILTQNTPLQFKNGAKQLKTNFEQIFNWPFPQI